MVNRIGRPGPWGMEPVQRIEHRLRLTTEPYGDSFTVGGATPATPHAFEAITPVHIGKVAVPSHVSQITLGAPQTYIPRTGHVARIRLDGLEQPTLLLTRNNYQWTAALHPDFIEKYSGHGLNLHERTLTLRSQQDEVAAQVAAAESRGDDMGSSDTLTVPSIPSRVTLLPRDYTLVIGDLQLQLGIPARPPASTIEQLAPIIPAQQPWFTQHTGEHPTVLHFIGSRIKGGGGKKIRLETNDFTTHNDFFWPGVKFAVRISAGPFAPYELATPALGAELTVRLMRPSNRPGEIFSEGVDIARPRFGSHRVGPGTYYVAETHGEGSMYLSLERLQKSDARWMGSKVFVHNMIKLRLEAEEALGKLGRGIALVDPGDGRVLRLAAQDHWLHLELPSLPVRRLDAGGYRVDYPSARAHTTPLTAEAIRELDRLPDYHPSTPIQWFRKVKSDIPLSS